MRVTLAEVQEAYAKISGTPRVGDYASGVLDYLDGHVEKVAVCPLMAVAWASDGSDFLQRYWAESNSSRFLYTELKDRVHAGYIAGFIVGVDAEGVVDTAEEILRTDAARAFMGHVQRVEGVEINWSAYFPSRAESWPQNDERFPVFYREYMDGIRDGLAVYQGLLPQLPKEGDEE